MINENKEALLNHLLEEQDFKISLNSVDPHLHIMQKLFAEMRSQVEKRIVLMKDIASTNTTCIKKIL